MSSKPRSIFFSFYFMAAFFILLGIMIVTLQPYLASWLSGYMMAPLHVLISWILMLIIIAVFLGIFALIIIISSKRRRGP